jgi:hypothetical protein
MTPILDFIAFFFCIAMLLLIVFVVGRIVSNKREQKRDEEKKRFVDNVLDGLRLDKMLSDDPRIEEIPPRDWESFT